MREVGISFLKDWQNFYIIVGTAAATLTGLMFVVMTLVTSLERQVASLDAGVSAFNTPTVVHFCAVLLLVGILSAPWQAYTSASLLLGLSSLGLVFYLIIVLQRMRRVPDYHPPLKDWLWYMVFPLSAYLALVASAFVLPAYPSVVLYIISALLVVLLFIGIHNAWDLVTFIAIDRAHSETRNRD